MSKVVIKKGDTVKFRNSKLIRSHYRGVEGVVQKMSYKLPHTCTMRCGNAGFDTCFHPNDVILVSKKKRA
jgi:signal peptidase I